MTVETTSRKQNFDGGQAELEFTFRALPEAPEDIKCIATSDAGVITYLEYNVDYTVAVNSDGIGGTVTLNPTFATTYTHTVYRETTIKQESDYDDYNPFPADTLETNIDRLTMIAQEERELGERTLKYPISSTGTDTNLPVPEAGKYIAWNAAGDGMENKDIPDPSTLIKASQVEAEAGMDNDNFMTALRTKQAITALQDDDIPLSYLSTSGTLAENSDTKVASQKAVKTYITSTLGDAVQGDGTSGTENLLLNGNFEDWSLGAAAVPDGWALSGAGSSVAREGTEKIIGSYSAAITTSGAAADFYQSFGTTTKGIAYFKGKSLTCGAWVKTGTASSVRVYVVSVNGTAYYSDYHTGGGGWEWLIVTTGAISAAATDIYAGVITSSTSGTFYVDGIMCVEGESSFAFSPKFAEEGILIDYSAVSTIVGFSSFTVKKIVFRRIGKMMFVFWELDGTSNANTLTFTLPFANTGGFEIGNMGYSLEGTTQRASRMFLEHGSSTVNIRVDGGAGVWATSGRKKTVGQFVYSL